MRHPTAQLRFAQFHEFKKRLLAPPLFLPAAAFAGGICLASEFDVNLALIWISVLLAGAGIAVSIYAKRRSAFWILLASCLAGALHMSSFELFPKHHVKFLADGKGSLQGTVASFPETVTKGKKRMTRFLLRAENWRMNRKTQPAEGGVQVFIFYAPETIRYGDRVRLWGELRAPKRATNPEEFDYATYLEKQGIVKVFQAFGAKSVRVLNASKPNWRARIENLRFQIQSRILKLFPYPEREIIQALWLGFRRNIPDEINNVFIRTGTIHLFSISGLHVTLVGGFFYFLFRMIGIARKPNAVFTILIILFYSVMAGGMPPVVRATLMGIFILGSILLEQDSESWHILIAAFLLILAASPGALFSLSFQLSFLSMTVLILFSQQGGRDLAESGRRFFEMTWKDKIRNWTHGTVRTSCLIIVLLLPVFASYFHLSSLSGVIANTMAIPVSLWVMILSLIAIFMSFIHLPLAVWTANLAAQLFSVLFWILSKISGISFLNWHLATPPLFAVFIYYAVLGIFYWHPYLKRAKPALIAAAVFIFLTVFSYGMPQGITFFDTGHSDAVLVKLSRKRHLLINAGRRLSESRLNWVIEPSLLSSGTRKIWVLPDDRRGWVDQAIMRYLAQNFSPAIFDTGKFSEIELSWQKNGKLAACRMTSSVMRALVIFRTSENLIQDLLREAAGGFDIIYISGEGEKGLDGRLISFLATSEAKHIIFNDRKLLSGSLNRLTGLGRSRLHFLSDNGAVSLSRIVR